MTLTRTGIAAIFSYSLYTTIENNTLLQSIILPEYIIIGIVCGLIGLIGFLCLAIEQAVGIFDGIGEKYNLLMIGGNNSGHHRCTMLGKLFTPMIGGVLHGLLVVAAPINLGDGSAQLNIIISADAYK